MEKKTKFNVFFFTFCSVYVFFFQICNGQKKPFITSMKNFCLKLKNKPLWEISNFLHFKFSSRDKLGMESMRLTLSVDS